MIPGGVRSNLHPGAVFLGVVWVWGIEVDCPVNYRAVSGPNVERAGFHSVCDVGCDGLGEFGYFFADGGGFVREGVSYRGDD